VLLIALVRNTAMFIGVVTGAKYLHHFVESLANWGVHERAVKYAHFAYVGLFVIEIVAPLAGASVMLWRHWKGRGKGTATSFTARLRYELVMGERFTVHTIGGFVFAFVCLVLGTAAYRLCGTTGGLIGRLLELALLAYWFLLVCLTPLVHSILATWKMIFDGVADVTSDTPMLARVVSHVGSARSLLLIAPEVRRLYSVAKAKSRVMEHLEGVGDKRPAEPALNASAGDAPPPPT
jgi:hypothetical protein